MAIPSASSNLSANQQKFLSGFVKTTGLDPTVAAAWLRNEEPNIQQNTDPAGHGAYNFLNIGITGAKNYGASSQYWKDPAAAGAASGQWLAGKLAIPGFGHSSTGIQKITQAAGLSPQQQIEAIQSSGWASGGEKALPSLYSQFSKQGGVGVAAVPAPAKTSIPNGVSAPSAAPAATGLSAQRNDLLAYTMNQNAVNAGQPGSTSAPTLPSLLSSALTASTAGKTVVAAKLPTATGKTIPVHLDPGVVPDHTTAGAIKVAEQFLGTPYHFGGANPKTGFDCSGLLQYAYAQMGIKIPRVTGDQIKAGTAVDNVQNAKPGDAIFFNGGEHVGMYLGNGQFIQAPHTGDVVKISKLAGYDGGAFAIRRYA